MERERGRVDIRAVPPLLRRRLAQPAWKAMSPKPRPVEATPTAMKGQERQAPLTAVHKLATHERWDYDQKSATLTFSTAACLVVG